MKTKSRKKHAPKVRYRILGDSLPDAVNGMRIELNGRSSAVIEGCRGVAEYDSESITLNGKPPLRIRGTGLELRSLDDGCAHIKGSIISVEYVIMEG